MMGGIGGVVVVIGRRVPAVVIPGVVDWLALGMRVWLGRGSSTVAWRRTDGGEGSMYVVRCRSR